MNLIKKPLVEELQIQCGTMASLSVGSGVLEVLANAFFASSSFHAMNYINMESNPHDNIAFKNFRGLLRNSRGSQKKEQILGTTSTARRIRKILLGAQPAMLDLGFF